MMMTDGNNNNSNNDDINATTTTTTTTTTNVNTTKTSSSSSSNSKKNNSSCCSGKRSSSSSSSDTISREHEDNFSSIVIDGGNSEDGTTPRGYNRGSTSHNNNNNNSNSSNSNKIFTNYDYLFKVILIGDSSVGKSCFLQKLVENKFVGDFMSTIGVDFKIKVMDLETKKVKIQIWDTAGQERYRNLTRSYYRNSNGIIIMYDITKQQSFDNLRGWITEIQNSGNEHIPILLLGNKKDLDSRRVVSGETGEQFAVRHGLQFLEISVKNDEDLENDCMLPFVRSMVEHTNNKQQQQQ